jgi:hypothetical protein
MEIKALGFYSALIKGKKENILINPSIEFLRENKNSGRIILFTNNDYDGIGLIDDKVLIKGAGEYEVGGVEVLGLDVDSDRTIYSINMEGISILVLGQLNESLSDKKIDRLNGIDVLLAPTSIGDKLSFKSIKEWSKKWGVNYLIPMGDNKEMLTKFLDEADEEGLEPIEVLKVEKENLPEGLELKLLKIV